MSQRSLPFLVLLLAFIFIAPVSQTFSGSDEQFPPPYPEIPRISDKQCLTLLGNKNNPPILIDVRLHKQWEQSKNKLPGAVHEDPAKVKSWASKYDKDRTIILY